MPLSGVCLCCLECQPHRGAPWLGSYSVVQCIRCLMGQPLYCSDANVGVCVGREALVMAPPPTRVSAVSPSMAAWLSSTGVSHHSLLPHISSISLSAVNSSPCPGITPQSLNSSSQPLRPLGYVWLRQGLSDSHSI